MISSDLLLPQDWSYQRSWQVPQDPIPDWITGTASENANRNSKLHWMPPAKHVCNSHMRNSYCKDLSTSPATEDSARPCWFSHLISFKNIYHLDGVSHELATIWKQLWSVWKIPFSIFLVKEYEKLLILYVSESKWELYQNQTFLMEVVFLMIKT